MTCPAQEAGDRSAPAEQEEEGSVFELVGQQRRQQRLPQQSDLTSTEEDDSECSCCCAAAATASGYLSSGCEAEPNRARVQRDSTGSSCCGHQLQQRQPGAEQETISSGQIAEGNDEKRDCDLQRQFAEAADKNNPSSGDQEAATASTKAEAEPAKGDEEKAADQGQEQEQERELALLKRRYVLTELIETERDYVADLGKIVEGYLDEIRRQLVDCGVADILTTGVVPVPSSSQLAQPDANQQPVVGSVAVGCEPAQQLQLQLAPAISPSTSTNDSVTSSSNTSACCCSPPDQQQQQQQQQTNSKAPALPEALKDGKHKIIFGNIEAIYEFHRDHFLAELERCLHEPQRLGPLFKRYERRLNMYVVYCQNKPRSEAIVSEYLDSYFEVSALKHSALGSPK